MIGILEFDLPEEREEWKLANEASQWRGVIYTLDMWLRERIKYGVDERKWVKPDVYCQEVRDELYRIMGDEDVSI